MVDFKKGVELSGAGGGAGLRVAIISAKWNLKIIEALVAGCVKSLKSTGVKDADILRIEVPGAYELPGAATQLIESKAVDAVICVGTLIKGETMHFEYICEAVSHGIMDLNLRPEGIPVIFGVLTCLTDLQALSRAGIDPAGKGHNHGLDWGLAAVEMVNNYRKIKKLKPRGKL
jgi:6,7-dimethyl-8-ribityllumazine synthase